MQLLDDVHELSGTVRERFHTLNETFELVVMHPMSCIGKGLYFQGQLKLFVRPSAMGSDAQDSSPLTSNVGQVMLP